MSDPNAPVTQELAGSVLTVTLNRPDLHNAMNPAIVAALTDIPEDKKSPAMPGGGGMGMGDMDF